MPNFIKIEESFCRRTNVSTYVDESKYVRRYVRTDGHMRPTLLGRLRRVNLKVGYIQSIGQDSKIFLENGDAQIHFSTLQDN